MCLQVFGGFLYCSGGFCAAYLTDREMQVETSDIQMLKQHVCISQRACIISKLQESCSADTAIAELPLTKRLQVTQEIIYQHSAARQTWSCRSSQQSWPGTETDWTSGEVCPTWLPACKASIFVEIKDQPDFVSLSLF